MNPIWQFLADTARRLPDGEAFVHGSRRLTWAELSQSSLALAARLGEKGLRADDRVLVLWENDLEFPRIYFALQRLGAVPVLLNPVSDAAYINRILADCRPAALIGQDPFLRRYLDDLDTKLLPPLVLTELPGDSRVDIEPPKPQVDPQAVALILYTSGSTGQPKGVVLSRENLAANTESIVDYLKVRSRDRVLVLLPFHYSYGHSVLLSHVQAGGTLVLDNRFIYPNAVLETLAVEKITTLPGVPSTFSILLHRSRFAQLDFPDLKTITIAGGAFAPPVLDRLREAVPRADVFVMYGQTEATARLSYLPPSELDKRPGSIGRGIPGVSLELLDKSGRAPSIGEHGEIVATGRNIMLGYWRDEEETARVIDSRGRLHTGDLARADEDGFLYIVGRNRDMIKSGGFRIHPREVEDRILELEGVAQAAVLGVQDELLGEAVIAVVVPGDSSPDADTIMSALRMKLPHWKLPVRILLRDTLPLTAAGKVRKDALREEYGG